MESYHLYKLIIWAKLGALTKYLLRKKLKIIVFHGIVDDDIDLDCWWMIKRSKFLIQIQYLYRNFNFISIDHALSGNNIPENSCVLTFDDGYKSVLTHAYPILREMNIPFTTYVSTGPVVKRTMIWTDKVFICLHNTNDKASNLAKLGLKNYSLASEGKEKNFKVAILNALKKMDYRKKNALVERLKNGNNRYLKYLQASMNLFEMLSTEDIKNLANDPLVTIGAHTVNHEVLTSMPFKEAVIEIKESRDILEQWTGKKILHFSYPDGKFNQALVNKVEELGFRSATRIGLKINWRNKPFELSRVGTGFSDDDVIFKSMVNGIIPLKIEVKDFIRKLKHLLN